MILKKVLLGILAAALLVGAGCNRPKQTTTTSAGNAISVDDIHSTVAKQLDAAGLGDVRVDVDKDKTLITLTGDVSDDASKAKAEQIAKDNATTFSVANEIGVRPQGMTSEAKDVSKNLDSAIEDNFKAALVSHHMNGHSLHYKSVNQTLELDGTVKSDSIRKQLEALAKDVPNVKEVVNKIDVKS